MNAKEFRDRCDQLADLCRKIHGELNHFRGDGSMPVLDKVTHRRLQDAQLAILKAEERLLEIASVEDPPLLKV